MLRVVVGRLAGGVVLTLVLTLLAYLVIATIPVEPDVNVRKQFGLDQPLLDQWGTFAWELGTEGSLGTSLSLVAPVSVNAIIGGALPATASLVLGGFVVTLLLAFPLGIVSALRRRSLLDRGILFFTVVGIVMHPFVVGLALKAVLAVRLGVAPEGNYCSLTGESPFFADGSYGGTCGGVVDWLSHLWLPWLTFAFFFLPIYTRIIRARMVENLGEQYVLTARAKGASERQVITRHVARNALGPVAAMLAVDVGTIVVAAIYIETVFGLNGIGLLVARNLSGASGYDRNILVGVVVVVALTITFANLLSDLVLRALDPRVRLGGAGSER
ncbi:MAG: ABC transporter permease [Gaiellaceae bacterium MAG52_C11]|nr:ABC transporter permease [Candidatus Gaiellasilicea maunaloa]